VKSFQSAEGLTADGIVGAHTWPALVVETSNGSTGDAVKAVQSQIASRPPSSTIVRYLELSGQRVPPWLRAGCGQPSRLPGLDPGQPGRGR
jgi:hypothetical protein